MTRPGKLKQRVQIWKHNGTRDAQGGFVDAPTLVTTVYADVSIDIGNRGLEFDQAKNDRPYLVKMRENTLIVINPNTYFFIWETRELEINSVVPDPDRLKYQKIRATEKIT